MISSSFGRFKLRAVAEHLDGCAIPVEGADIDVLFAGPKAEGDIAAANPGVDEGSEVFVAFFAIEPKLMQRLEDAPGHFECAPYPVRSGVGALDLDFEHVALFVGNDGVE